MDNNIKVPKRRFRGMCGEWETQKLGDLANKVTAKNVGTQYVETLTNSAEQGIVSQRDYFEHDVSNIENIDGYYIVEDNDFVYNPRISSSAPVGPVNRNKLGRTGVMSPLYTVFRTHDIDESYLEWFFKSNHWHKFMYFNGDTGARADRFAIKDTVFFEMPIPMPDIEKQSKVGGFIMELDHLIGLHQCKVSKLQNLKKAYLSDMFPKPGEKVPVRRFKGFTGDWEQRKLGEISDFITKGATPTTYGFEWVENGIPFFRNDSIKDNVFVYGDYSYISEEANTALNRSEIKADDILVAITGDIGKVGIVPKVIEKGNINQHMARVRILNEAVPYFVYQYLSTDRMQRQYMKIKTGLSMPQLSLEQIRDTDIELPSYEEQKKIAKHFSKLDNLITLHQRKLAKLQALKKAYLTEMFP